MSGWRFNYALMNNHFGYTGRTTMDNDRPLAERVARLEAALAQLTARYERGDTEPTDPPDTPDPAPYRMPEPDVIGAVVISGDERYVCTGADGYNWVEASTGYSHGWKNITNPQPYQNCVLTADDPEPPVKSVVRSPEGVVSERGDASDGPSWKSYWSDRLWWWDEVTETPVTLLYRGKA